MILTALAGLVPAAAGGQQADTNVPGAVDSAGGAPLEVSEAYPGLLRLATVSPEAAVQTALGKVKRGQFLSAAIENRGRHLVYVIRIDERHDTRELLVDAETDRVLSNHKVLRHEAAPK